MKKSTKAWKCRGAVAAIVLMLGMAVHARAEDKVKIIQVVPDSLFLNNVETDVAVEIEYNLESSDEGIVYLGFNTVPNASVIEAEVIVKKGGGKVTLKAKVKPVDLRGAAPFYAYVNISAHPHEKSWKPLASAKKKIKTRRRVKSPNKSLNRSPDDCNFLEVSA